jgi:O-antigen ligase
MAVMAPHATRIASGSSPAIGWAVACFGLMASLPFLVPLHQHPLTSFHSEWLAALLGVLAILCLFAQKQAAPLQLPALALAPALLMLVVALQWALGRFAYAASATMVLLYLAWAGLTMVAGRSLASLVGGQRLVAAMAWSVLAGGLLNGALGICQYLQVQLPFLIAAEGQGNGVYGNLAQQNHFATQMALAIASMACLLMAGRMAWRWAVLAGPVLLAALLLSASRSSALYLGWIALMLVPLLRQRWPQRRVLAILAALVVLAVVALLALSMLTPVPLLDRAMSMSTALAPRWFAWKHAIQMFASAPLLGVGFDGFAFHMVGQLEHGVAGVVWGIDQYAHNLLLQLMAVSGLCGALALVIPAGLFVRHQLAQAATAERMWQWSMLGVLALHSMLEQPLYFTYFLGLAALIAGMADVKSAAIVLRPWMARACLGVMVAALLLLGKTAVEYRQLDAQFFSGTAGEPVARGQLVRALRAHSLLGPIAELVSPGDIVPANAPVADKLALSERARRFAPTAEVEFRHAALLAQAGHVEQAKKQFARAASAYPRDTAPYFARFRALAARDPAVYGELAAFASTRVAP